MSITFKNPPHLMMISDAQPNELELLIETIKKPSYFIELDPESVKSKTIRPKCQPKEDVKTMTIGLMSQYPAITGVGFPKTLTELTISNLNYRHLENRIIALESLKKLDLSGNRLTKLPRGLWDMKSLIHLNVENNQISEIPSFIPANSNVCKNIQCLIISNNKLDHFPEFLRHCKWLNTLRIAGNQINFVPNYLKACSSSLRVLDIDRCNLKNLPACLINFSLNDLLLDGNPFPPKIEENAIYKGKHDKSWSLVPSLQACCVKSVIRHGVRFSRLRHVLPQPLINYVHSRQYCNWCQRLVMENSILYYYEAELKKFARTFSSLSGSAPFISGYVCSSFCFKRIQEGKKVIPATIFFKQFTCT